MNFLNSPTPEHSSFAFYNPKVKPVSALPTEHNSMLCHRLVGTPIGTVYKDGTEAKIWHTEFLYPHHIRTNKSERLSDQHIWTVQETLAPRF